MDKGKTISILVNVILALLLIGAVIFALRKPDFDCSTCQGQLVVRIDTVYYSASVLTKPVLTSSVKKVRHILTADTESLEMYFEDDTARALETGIVKPSPCDSVRTYFDSVGYKGHYVAIWDTLRDNSFIGRRIAFGGFTEAKSATKTLKDKPKVFLGLRVGYSPSSKGYGIGVAGSVYIPKIGIVTYDYDAKNDFHAVSILALLRFKK